MEQLKMSSRALLLSAVIMIIILITGPFGYKFGLVPLLPSLASLLVAMLGSAIVLLVALVFIFLAIKNGLGRNRNMLLLTVALSLVPIIIMAPQIVKGRSVPPIHDITTDTDNPPAFNAIVKLRVHAANDLEYGSEAIPADEMAELQAIAYPAVQPLHTPMEPLDAVTRAEEVLREQGLKIVTVDEEALMVEATATTYWFGFKDDLVVRVTPGSDGSIVDVRSVSRVGQSDLGANAARIEKFLTVF